MRSYGLLLMLVSLFAAGCANDKVSVADALQQSVDMGFGPAIFEVSVSEALQQPVNGKVYTRCNIWFEDPENISCINYQHGRVLPIGSEVTPISASQHDLVFEDTSGIRYHIEFDPETMMIPVPEYIRRVLTITPPDQLLKDVPPERLSSLKAGTVVPGMTREEVILCFGYPVPGRTPDLSGSSYLYYQGPDRTFRVVFKGNEVRRVIAPQN
ncbi:MAG: hypothetical protein AB7F40_11080 [Victivallaceae bacterium]|nr:hypothetical protein [Victivallaceae bacterium]